jgi:pimeloyl-ACP methyl ester carboxylesterase
MADLLVPRGSYRIYAEESPGPGVPVVLMHGFPDSVLLYDRLLPHLSGHRATIRFDFLGWGRSDKPVGYPYTANNQVGDIDAVLTYLGVERVVLVAHDASGPPAIDWALDHPERVEELILLNTYYHAMAPLRRPPAIALYSTPGLGALARSVVRLRPNLDRRLFFWQVGGFILDSALRQELVPRLYADFVTARPAFWRLNQDLLGTVLSRRRRRPQLHRFEPPVTVMFGEQDRYLNAGVARRLAAAFPNSQLHLVPDAGHYIQVDQPEQVAAHLRRKSHHETNTR